MYVDPLYVVMASTLPSVQRSTPDEEGVGVVEGVARVVGVVRNVVDGV